MDFTDLMIANEATDEVNPKVAEFVDKHPAITGIALTAGLIGMIAFLKMDNDSGKVAREKAKNTQKEREANRNSLQYRMAQAEASQKKRIYDSYKLNLTPYSNDKFKTRDALLSSLEKDLKLWVNKIIHSKAFSTIAESMITEYGITREEFKKWCDCESLRDIQSNFKVSLFEEESDSLIVYEILTGTQEFNSIFSGIIEDLAKIVEIVYTEYCTANLGGDGDEGVLNVHIKAAFLRGEN